MKTRKKRITKVQHFTRLAKLYPSCKHDSVFRESHEGHNITYGEMEYEGIKTLYEHARRHSPSIHCFMDIGSGRGKLCMYMAAYPEIKKVVGIELMKERHDDAEKLKTDLESPFAKKVQLINEDLFEVKFPHQTSFIWFSNLCFPPDKTAEVFEKIKNEMPKGTIVCCSNKPDLTPLETIEVPMSWDKKSTVHLFMI